MRLLALETSGARTSVALLQGEEVLCSLEHPAPQAHAEQLLPLIEQALARVGWQRRDLERCAVDIGPGSFTGIRVGVALALGLSQGLAIPAVGVSSLLAMATAGPAELRSSVLDAGRGEVFVAAYGSDLQPLIAPSVLAADMALAWLEQALGARPLLLGNGAPLLGASGRVLRGRDTNEPRAEWVARVGARLAPSAVPVPLYVRDSVAAKPNMPPNPLGSPA